MSIFETPHHKESKRVSNKNYYNTENGKQKIYECIARYHQTYNRKQKIYEANLRYGNKQYLCSTCNIQLLNKSRYTHNRSSKHIKNVNIQNILNKLTE